MKRLLPFLLISSVHAVTFDDVAEYVEETFDISATSDIDGNFYATLKGSHKVTDEWRLFGEYTTKHSYELGVGYSFFMFDLYNEVSVKVADSLLSNHKPHIGLFTAGLVYDVIWFTNVELGYSQTEFELDYLRDIKYEGLTFNKSIGLLYETTDYLELAYSFNHDAAHHWIKFYNKHHTDGAFLYQDISATFKIKGVKPSLTYTFGDFSTIEFGLSFDF